MSSEIEQTERFLADCAWPGLKNVLKQHLEGLRVNNVEAHAPATSESSSARSSEQIEFAGKTGGAAAIRESASSSSKYINLEDISWDQGTNSFDSPTVTVYVGLPGVGQAKDRVQCKFGSCSIDLIVTDLDGKNYRYVQSNLEKDIIPDSSKVIVKNNKIILKLAKVKGQYSYESWQNLVAKKKRDPEVDKKKKDDPTSGIMDMMKNLYEEGDDNMKKVIGEAMLKSQRGEKSEPPEPMNFDIDEPSKRKI